MTPHITPRGPLLGAGREADVYAYGDDAVLKLYRPGFDGHRNETAVLRSLDGHGIAPTLMNVVDCDGRTGLVVERISGPDMLTLLQQRPWTVLVQARRLANAHLAVHRVQAPSALADLRQVLAERIKDAALPTRLSDFVSGLLDMLPDGGRVCHGDYHPGNVLLTAGQTAVIDWGAATRGAPAADHARTLLLLRRADPLPETPPLARTLIAAGRALLTDAYARAYRRDSPPLHQTRPWLLVQAAARVSEGIAAEKAMLIEILERAQR